MISVVLMTYNQSIKDILFSINSVILQNDCDFELIVADDCSQKNPGREIRSYLESRSFTRFKFLRAEENKGIVANLLSGVKACSGQVIKPLSPGDAFYSNDVLAKIEDFCSSTEAQIGFGRLAGYTMDGVGIKRFPYQAPTKPQSYNNESIELRKLLSGQIIGTDWIPGCSLFYRRDFIVHYLRKLVGEYGVKYSEDLTVPLITIDGIRPRYLDDFILWYEIGSGISTKGSSSSIRRLYSDHRRFFDKLSSSTPNDPLFIRARKAFLVREFVALRTPFYRLAQGLVRSRYSKSENCGEPFSTDGLTFFEECKNFGAVS